MREDPSYSLTRWTVCAAARPGVSANRGYWVWRRRNVRPDGSGSLNVPDDVEFAPKVWVLLPPLPHQAKGYVALCFDEKHSIPALLPVVERGTFAVLAVDRSPGQPAS